MAKEITCPWCQEKTETRVSVSENQYGRVSERRCDKCDKVLAAYNADEGDFLPRIRVFENESSN